MSISTEISRLQANRNTIRAKLVELGVGLGTDTLNALATKMENIINQGAASVTIREGETYTIPKGYHNGSGTVSGVAGGGNYTLEPTKSVTPTKSQQNITPSSGFYGIEGVTVAPIPDMYQDVTSVSAAAGDVLTGKIIVTSTGEVVTGTMTNNGAVDKTLSVAVVTYTIPKGYHSGSGTVKIVLETKSVTPTKSTQDITPTAGKVLSKVTVAPIPDEYITTTDADALASELLEDKTAYVDGVKVIGTMMNNGDVTTTIDGITTTSVDITEGYTSGGTISLTSDIEDALMAI